MKPVSITMTKLFARALALWAPILAATSGLFLFAYWGIQQEYRMTANDPQVQMAEDGAALLSAGGVPAEVVPHATGEPAIDLAHSLAPWTAVFDSSGTPLESTARVGQEPLRLPLGVFDESAWTRESAPHETRFTWQPSAGIRQAVVLVHADNGQFVASGRSLRETESRIATLTRGAALLWGISELAAFVLIILALAVG